MRWARAILPAAALAVVAAGLSSCGGEPATPAKPQQTELAQLSVQLENWAGRAEQIIHRPWSKFLEFPKRLHVRIQAIRSFGQDAAAAAAPGTPDADVDRLTQRARTLMTQGRPFESALTLLEREVNTLDQIAGYDRLIELHMPPLESRGEAPFRIRVTNLRSQAALGFKHLDEALEHTLDQSPDAATHEKIANAALREALQTSAKLSEEVKKSASLASAAIDRQRALKNRIDWAESIVKKAKDGVPAEATKALKDARDFVEGPLATESAEVLELLRNAQPDGAAKADDLARRADAVIQTLTAAFLDLGRKLGVPDPVSPAR